MDEVPNRHIIGADKKIIIQIGFREKSHPCELSHRFAREISPNETNLIFLVSSYVRTTSSLYEGTIISAPRAREKSIINRSAPPLTEKSSHASIAVLITGSSGIIETMNLNNYSPSNTKSREIFFPRPHYTLLRSVFAIIHIYRFGGH